MDFSRHAVFTLARRFMAFVKSDSVAQSALRSLIAPATDEFTVQEQSPLCAVSSQDQPPSPDAEGVSADTSMNQLCPEPQSKDGSACFGDSVELIACDDDLLAESDGQSSAFARLAGFGARFRLKAEACCWSKERSLLKRCGASHRTEVAPKDRAILDKAKQMGCYLWMCTPDFRLPEPLELIDALADWFQVTAEACEVADMLHRKAQNAKAFTHDLLPLLAESQSGLRLAVSAVAHKSDPDQTDFYHAVRKFCTERSTYLDRFLKVEEAPELSAARNLGDRIQQLRQRIEERLKTNARRRKLLGKLRHQLRPEQQQRDPDGYWTNIASTVDQLVGIGVPPSSLELRSLLKPIIHAVPASHDWPKGFRLTLRDIRGATTSMLICQGRTSTLVNTPDVQKVRRLLAGRQIVLIGGDRRPLRQARIEQAFGLESLVWAKSDHGTSVATFEPLVARSEVVIVLLAIRWASHIYTDVGVYCDKYGKPLVRLPGGYGINQIAKQILVQCSHRLGLPQRDTP